MGYTYRLTLAMYQTYRTPQGENDYKPLCKTDEELMRELSHGLKQPVTKLDIRGG